MSGEGDGSGAAGAAVPWWKARGFLSEEDAISAFDTKTKDLIAKNQIIGELKPKADALDEAGRAKQKAENEKLSETQRLAQEIEAINGRFEKELSKLTDALAQEQMARQKANDDLIYERSISPRLSGIPEKLQLLYRRQYEAARVLNPDRKDEAGLKALLDSIDKELSEQTAAFGSRPSVGAPGIGDFQNASGGPGTVKVKDSKGQEQSVNLDNVQSVGALFQTQ